MTYRLKTWKVWSEFARGGSRRKWRMNSMSWLFSQSTCSFTPPSLPLSLSLPPSLARLLVGICNFKKAQGKYRGYSHFYFFCCRHVPQWNIVCSGLKKKKYRRRKTFDVAFGFCRRFEERLHRDARSATAEQHAGEKSSLKWKGGGNKNLITNLTLLLNKPQSVGATLCIWPHIKKQVKYINSPNFGPGTLILLKLLLPAPRPCGSASADRAALTGNASRGNLTQPPSAAFDVVCAQSLLSLSYALYDPAAEKKRRGREGERRRGGGGGGGEKSCKSRPGVARINTTGEFLRQRRSGGATGVFYLLTPKDAGARKTGRRRNASGWVCVTRKHTLFLLQPECTPPNVHSKTHPRVGGGGGEVMCATWAIMSSRQFGHGLVKAEPWISISSPARSSVPCSTRESELKGPGRLSERGWSTWTGLKIERSLSTQTHTDTHRHTQGARQQGRAAVFSVFHTQIQVLAESTDAWVTWGVYKPDRWRLGSPTRRRWRPWPRAAPLASPGKHRAGENH